MDSKTYIQLLCSLAPSVAHRLNYLRTQIGDDALADPYTLNLVLFSMQLENNLEMSRGLNKLSDAVDALSSKVREAETIKVVS